MGLVKLLLISALASIILGQLIRFSVFSQTGAITPTDVFVLTLDIVFLIEALFVKRRILFPKNIFFPAALFTLSAFSSTVLAVSSFSLSQISVSLLFLFRFLIYFISFIVVINCVSRVLIDNWVHLILATGLIFAILGLFQFIVFPDLSFLAYWGWDPHQRRMVSTFLDPNFAGFILGMFAAFSISLYLFKKKLSYLFLFVLFLSTQLLTFSRSSYLAFMVMMLTIGILKSPKTFFVSLIIFILAFSIITPVRTRIIGAVKLDETSRARLESWQNAIDVFKGNPIFGVGFNTYRFAQAKYGFFTTDNPLGGHSGSGTDSSFLLVLATTGIVGTFFYLFLLFSVFLVFVRKAKSNYLKLASLSSYLGLIVHSQFVNSLFFPQIVLFLWVILGLSLKNDT